MSLTKVGLALLALQVACAPPPITAQPTPPGPAPVIERVRRVSFRVGDVQITERYTVRWTPDGFGPVDSLRFTASATGQAIQIVNVPNPQFPRSFSITWNTPNFGDSTMTQGCATVIRRGASSQACSAVRTYRIPDQPPPPPVVDTTLLLARIDLKPDSVQLSPGVRRQFCVFVVFKDNKVPEDRTALNYCRGQWLGWFTAAQRAVSPAQRARADSLYAGTLTLSGGRSFRPTPLQSLASRS